MAAPAIDPESGVLIYPQWLTWEHQFSATNNPYDWAITSGAFPTGMTFQPSGSVTVSATGDTVNWTAHGLANGTCVVFRSLTGGTGLAINTRYFVVNAAADTFKLSTTPGGSAIDVTVDYTAALIYRPGFLTGAGTVPGVSDVRITATNADPATSAEVLFSLGIISAAAAPDANADLVWDLATDNLIVQTNSTLNLTPADRATPILFFKEHDDRILRLRTVKNASIIDLGAIDDDACLMVVKEVEPDAKIEISTNSQKIGTGDANSILIYIKLNGSSLAGALSNYEDDKGTILNALVEIELTYPNPYFASTPATLRRTSKTFTIQIERDLGDH
ncbi:hypothetical protein CfE428DRAFT_5786 [Chthoniobacter flavus Ellin428]|uniref:Uncharacterized protein n=1 Tax=Chthoniobacter flavus Ellin428 TaxID=497964 RepID=B4DA46_9BACT|nr:hypothetical protein [Chthoniobacter flavus]EDY16673.1 hypothetical protein CfE428DRAFT_5786 [Chthoniobacter flavus Ellin428]TCO87247.1 hypothetical protein EV701_12384 [Chthoniobacter flavus]